MQDQDKNKDKLPFPELEPADIIADELDKERFKCSICHGIVRDPSFCSNLKCGKPFCKACLHQNEIVNKTNDCSLCKNKDGFREISYIERDSINNIKLRCKYLGCCQYLKYMDYMEHLENCKYRVYYCKNKPCNAQGNKDFLEDHKKKCNYRKIICECKTKIVFHLFEKHIKEGCPEALVSCRYCDEKIKRKNLEEHEKKNENAECIKDQYKKSQEEIKTMKKKLAEKNKEIKSEKKHNSNLEKEIEKLTKLLEELRKLINNGLNEPNEKIEENH